MHRQELLRAGSRRAYHPGVGWDLGAAKSCMFRSLGPAELIPGCSNDIFGRFRQCILRFHGWRVPRILLQEETTVIHPTRASERGRARVGPTTDGASLEPTNDFSTSSSTFEFRSVVIARHLSFGQLFCCLKPHHFCGAIQNFVVDVDPKALPQWQARIKTLIRSGPIPLSETAFNGFVFYCCLLLCLADTSLGVGIMFTGRGEIRSRFWIPSLSRRCSMSIA